MSIFLLSLLVFFLTVCRSYLDSRISRDSTLRSQMLGEKQVFHRLSSVKKHNLYGCTVKKINYFPVPSRDVTDQTLPGREKFNYSRPGRVWPVTSRLGTGKWQTFFYSVDSLWKAQLWNKECEPKGWNLDDNAQRRADCRIGQNEFNNVWSSPETRVRICKRLRSQPMVGIDSRAP